MWVNWCFHCDIKDLFMLTLLSNICAEHWTSVGAAFSEESNTGGIVATRDYLTNYGGCKKWICLFIYFIYLFIYYTIQVECKRRR